MAIDIGDAPAVVPTQAERNAAAKALQSAYKGAEAGAVLTKYGKVAFDLCLAGLTIGTTAATHSLSTDYARFSSVSRKVEISASTGQLRFPAPNFTADPDDHLVSIDVYLPFHPDDLAGTGLTPAISIRLINTNNSSAPDTSTWNFGASYLRQGWNTLKMWSGDTVGAAGTGNLPYGVGRTQAGLGVDFDVSFQYLDLTFTNMSGQTVYLDQVRRAAKAAPVLVLGFDATGSAYDDEIFPDEVAPLLATVGAKGYTTLTHVYEMLFAGSQSWTRQMRLYNEFGWDVLNHSWNHGATEVGRHQAVSVSRTSNVATVTVSGGHGITVGRTIKASIKGATPSDLNGVFTMTVTSSTLLTYSATGADGAATGTIFWSTWLSEVINADTAELQAICDHEFVDTSKAMRGVGFARAAHIAAYPNNSVPFLPVMEETAAKAGVKFARAVRGGYCMVNEFGVDNPLNFGSFSFESGTNYTRLSELKTKVDGAIARGEHIWIFGHYILDETTLGTSVDLEYPPGQGGNPAPPAGSLSGTGGWWYLGSLRRLLEETVAPAVAAGTLTCKSASEWSASLGALYA